MSVEGGSNGRARSPSKPMPGSLRNKIAAFEKPSVPAAAASASNEVEVSPHPDPPLTASATEVPSPPLDALLSPQGTFDGHLPTRTSAAEPDFNEVALDDDAGFSTVPLSARQSVDSVSSNAAIKSPRTSLHDTRRRTISNQRLDLATSVKQTSHKKSASSSTTNSAGNLQPFMLQRLDIQKVQEGDPKVNRNSMDGQQKLHEEFVRKQNERLEAESAPNGTIDWDFWGAVISDYQTFASENAERLARAIEKGIPGTLRGMMWQLMAASKDPELEATYLKLLKETSPREKAIIRDLGRTFPHHEFFTDGQGIGQENLFNVLKAYSLHDPHVGYCQGLPFIVAILLLNMPDEEAFSLLVRLMYSYDLRGHFLPEMPKLQLRLFQFDRLVEELLPVLNIHFLRQGVKSSMFCSQWFLTMFSYRFPLDIVFRIYDNCLASGIEAIFGFSLVLLHKNEDILLTLNFDEILTFLKTRVFERYKIERENQLGQSEEKEISYMGDEFVQDAVSLKITPFMLDSYAHEYEELVRNRDAHAIEVDALRNSNRALSAQVKNLENNLAQLNGEHVEVLNQLVMSRLRNEEIEGELVRYKLLYAEAMHQNADALSSHRLSTATTTKRGSNGSKG